MKYDVIFIDVDNTILDFNQAEVYALRKTCEKVGYPYSEMVHKMYDETNHKLWEMLEMGKIDLDTLKQRRFMELVEAFEIDYSPLEMSRLYMGYLGEATYEIEGAYEVCESLSQKCQLIVVTNGITHVQRSRFASSRLANFISEFIISEEVGYSKPHPEIFEVAMRHARVKDKNKVLMIGDSLTSDMAGGQAAGIDTCFYNPKGLSAKGNSEEVQRRCTYEIRDLREVLEIVKS